MYLLDNLKYGSQSVLKPPSARSNRTAKLELLRLIGLPALSLIATAVPADTRVPGQDLVVCNQ